jgi:uncharacterized protein
MSEQNRERIRSGYEALARGDLDEVLELMDPEVVMRDRPEIPDPGVYRGHEGVLAALAQSLDYFDEVRFVPEEIHDAGDNVVVVLRMHGRGKESGVPVEERIAHLWTIRDDKAKSLQVYSDPEEALADAGIESAVRSRAERRP